MHAWIIGWTNSWTLDDLSRHTISPPWFALQCSLSSQLWQLCRDILGMLKLLPWKFALRFSVLWSTPGHHCACSVLDTVSHVQTSYIIYICIYCQTWMSQQTPRKSLLRDLGVTSQLSETNLRPSHCFFKLIKKRLAADLSDKPWTRTGYLNQSDPGAPTSFIFFG